jgi:hypothetical protein
MQMIIEQKVLVLEQENTLQNHLQVQDLGLRVKPQ